MARESNFLSMANALEMGIRAQENGLKHPGTLPYR